ncbi:uncharacterized protein [Spinacia oleracea]|uniref:Integrase catalytic domain-containing protein n=1 Tax=Spinacia oleracea TaxID=3562 RepID=A0ABM3R7X0_SPIOL|nr:uncharacterized protein LOC130467259 [Spinacia oleracea]
MCISNSKMLADQQEPSQNPNSAYYLSSSDLNATKLVSIEFKGKCFSDWRRSMMIALSAKNKLCFVDGSLNQPAPNSSNHRIWTRYVLPTISKAYGLLLQEEQQNEVHNHKHHSHTESTAFNGKFDNKPYKGSYNNIPNSQYAGAGNQYRSFTNRNNLYCEHCKMRNHTIDKCWKLHGYPKDFKGKGKRIAAAAQLDEYSPKENKTDEGSGVVHATFTEDQYTQLIKCLHTQLVASQAENSSSQSLGLETTYQPQGTFCLMSKLNRNWILDSGASDHMCSDLSLFKSFDPVIDGKHSITVTDGTEIQDPSKNKHTLLGKLEKGLYSLSEEFLGCVAESFCQICPLAKQTRFPFPNSCIRSTRPFKLLHQFLVDVATQFELSVKHIRSDNALDLTEGKMKELFLNKGILHQKSCSYTPQQNGVVERKHKHLLETTRALAFQSKLPDRYWNHCILTATYLINRMPLKSIDFCTPYERLYKTKPYLSQLRIFGCLCYITTPKIHRSKFDRRVEPCVFLGYPPNQKAYKVLNLATNTLIVSRDVIFYEKHIPFHYSPTPKQAYSTQFFLPITTPFTDSANTSSPILDSLSSPSTSSSPILTPSTSSSPTQSSEHSPSHVSNSSPIQSTEPPEPPQRKSTRVSKPPSHLNDFVCSKPVKHWCNLVAYDSLHEQ